MIEVCERNEEAGVTEKVSNGSRWNGSRVKWKWIVSEKLEKW